MINNLLEQPYMNMSRTNNILNSTDNLLRNQVSICRTTLRQYELIAIIQQSPCKLVGVVNKRNLLQLIFKFIIKRLGCHIYSLHQ